MESNQTFMLVLEKAAKSSPEEAYDAFTLPEHLSRWFTTDSVADLKVGGRYSNADGDKGVFTALERPARIAFTWDNEKHCPGTTVNVAFYDEGDIVKIRLEHSGLKSQGDLEDMKGGWSWALDSLKSYLETGKPIPHEAWLKMQGDK